MIVVQSCLYLSLVLITQLICLLVVWTAAAAALMDITGVAWSIEAMSIESLLVDLGAAFKQVRVVVLHM